MKLACNYYPETERLVQTGKIDIDYFKLLGVGYQAGILENELESFTERVTKIKPVLLHGLYPAPHNLSSQTLIDDFDFEIANKLISLTQTPGISFHPSLTPYDPAIPEQQFINTIIKNIIFIREKYSHMDFVSIENIDSLKYGSIVKPEVFTDIINQAQCSFILDISHAYCASLKTGEDFREYLLRLPLKQVYEIHINGWFEKDSDIMCHLKINDAGYEILKDLLDYCEPKIITIEYGRSDDRLGSGCPVMSPDKYNADAELDIIEQVNKIRDII